MKRHILYVPISALLLVAFSWAQEDLHTVPVPAIIGPEMPYTEVLTPPMPVSGVQMPLTFSSENPRSNFVMGTLQFGASYDDNMFTTPVSYTHLTLPTIYSV